MCGDGWKRGGKRKRFCLVGGWDLGEEKLVKWIVEKNCRKLVEWAGGRSMKC